MLLDLSKLSSFLLTKRLAEVIPIFLNSISA
jgi:hypothetical protein